jgi:hypothetical protein
MVGTRLSVVCASACFCAVAAIAIPLQEISKPPVPYPAALPRLEELARRIASRETELFSVWLQYTYRQYIDIRVEYLGKVTKENLTIVSEVVFLDDGRREVRVIERRGGFSQLKMGPGVEEVLNNLLPFALTERELPNYALEYLRTEKLGRKLCHVLSVQPKQIEDGRVYFEGEIWVEAKTLQIVRTVGRPVPQSESSAFPDFDTVRETVDGKYLFPVRAVSNSLLSLPKGAIRIQQIVQYKNYRRFGSNVKVGFPDRP